MIKQLLDKIPDYSEFLTIDEMDANSIALAKKYPETVALMDLGKSRDGNTIYCLKIGNGSKNALLYGCPHPNEPMGAMMLEFLSEELATNKELRDAYDYTWYLIKSIDIDGTKLNEGWFKGDLTLTRYARDFFRPAGYEQVEWTYPFDYKGYVFDKPLPETKMLMELIDTLKPEFVYALHNAGFGGTYWYISKDFKPLWKPFYESSKKQDIPLHLGEPEVNYITPFAQAIYPMLTSKDSFDYYEKFGDAKKMMDVGTCTQGYMNDTGVDGVVLVTELPYFYESRIQSDKLLDKTRKEAYIEGLNFYTNEMKNMKDIFSPLRSYMSDDNPFFKMVDVSFKHAEEGYDAALEFVNTQEEYQNLCKESEDFDSNVVKRFYMLLSWGLALRSIEFELEKDPDSKELQEAKTNLESIFNEKAFECENLINYKVIPIKKLVSIQLESGLLTMDYIQNGAKDE